MATTRKKDGRLLLQVYFTDKKVTRLIERAAEIDNRSTSAFMAHAAEQAARRIVDKQLSIEDRKRLAAERQLGEASA